MASVIHDTSYIKSLVTELNSIVDDPNGIKASNRAIALRSVEKLKEALETPSKAIAQYRLMHITFSCVMVAVDLGLFNILAAAKGEPKTAEDLAKTASADPLLIVRIMRVLTAMGFAKEVAELTYASTPKAEVMTESANAAGIRHISQVNLLPAVKLPEYLKSNGYRNPTNAGKTPFQYAWQTDDSLFGWMQKRPEESADFDTFMQGVRSDRVNWWDWFPVQQEVLKGLKEDAEAVLMIDVGGGRGQDLMSFQKKFPEAPGRLILQDQAHVIDGTHLSEGIEKMSYDFFTPQPVKGARIYFEHYILHDWDDDQCVQILKSTASAMTKGYSKLYLNEWILPTVGCSLYEATIDVQMMTALAGMERTESQWKELLHRAGLKLEKFWLSPGPGEGIIEASI